MITYLNRYNNYHKHTHVSNIFTPDTHIKTKDYVDRIIELGDIKRNYFTTEHGSGGDIFESKTICDNENIHCKFGIEGYIVPDSASKDKSNYHIVIIPKNNISRKKLNRITTRASLEGYYYKPRIFLEDLLKLDRDDVFITTACIAGILRTEEAINSIFNPLVEHFHENVMIEVQAHWDFSQIEHNKTCLNLAKKYNLPIIAATDSHYIYPKQAQDRLNFLAGKHIVYEDEGNFILDYPDYDTLFDRFKKQGVLNKEQILSALNQTLVFDDCEDISINKNIKMPSIYKDKTSQEKIEILEKIVENKFKTICKEEHLNSNEISIRESGIKEEMQVIKDTSEINTADYFLLNERIVDLATNKYGGVLTRTGRGSCGAEYLNRVLGMTQIDRFNVKIPLYPERFMSTARLLENHAMPDIDYNVVSQEPFILAAKEVLGENSCRPMIAYGTMQEPEAFRNVCRSKGMSHDEYNEVAKNLDKYRNAIEWEEIFLETEKYVDTIVSASIHPCAYLLMNEDVEEELGVVKIGDKFCALITSGEADEYKYLKDDFLIVTVWKLISETFESINQPIIPLRQLLNSLDESVWDMYSKGFTCTLNQIDSDYATQLMLKYKAKTVEELQQFVAAVRPSFDSWRNEFLDRKPYSYGVKELDELLKPTNGYLTFQETIMQFFGWLGVSPAESIGLIKKISKKKIKQEDFDALESDLRKEWEANTGSTYKFDDVWNDIQGCLAYGFAAPHAYATAIDSLYGAYLKSHYPIEYYTVALNNYKNDPEKTGKLVDELAYFKISVLPPRYGISKSEYSFDKEKNIIGKDLSSIKFLNSSVANELYEISQILDTKYFMDVLLAASNFTSINSRQLNILIKIGYFDIFGNCNELLKITEMFDFFKQGTAKTINKEKLHEPLKDIIKDFAKDTNGKGKELKSYTITNMYGLLLTIEVYIKSLNLPDLDYKLKAAAQNDYLGYIDLTTNKEEDRRKLYILDVYELADHYKGGVWKYKIKTKSIGSGKVASLDISPSAMSKNPIRKGDIIYAANLDKDKKGYWQLLAYKKLQ